MSCEQKKDKICRATGAAYGLTGTAGNNVATTVWASPMIARAQFGTTFDERYNDFLTSKGMGLSRIRKIMNKKFRFSAPIGIMTRRQFTEYAFARGWQGYRSIQNTPSGSKYHWTIGKGRDHWGATKAQVEYLNSLYRGQNTSNKRINNIPTTATGPFVVLDNPDPEYPHLAVHTWSGEGYLLPAEYPELQQRLSARATEILLNEDVGTALETFDYFGVPVSKDAGAVTQHHNQEPTQTILIASDKNGEWITAEIANPQEAGFKIVGTEMQHSCGGLVEAATRKVEHGNTMYCQTICKCRKCSMIIILGGL